LPYIAAPEASHIAESTELMMMSQDKKGFIANTSRNPSYRTLYGTYILAR
jgi:hypothetical protein